MNNTLPEPHTHLRMRFTETGPLIIAGLCEPMTASSQETIPRLWQQLTQRINEIPNRIDAVGYGLCLNNRGFHYMAGYAVWDFAELSPGINHIVLPAQTYGVFVHEGSVGCIRKTIDAIFDHWLPNSNYTQHINNAVYFFERYGEGFDAETGTGDIEIWIPLEKRN